MFGTGLYLLVACMCCCVFGNKGRARHTSRWPMPTLWWRVEQPLYVEEEADRAGQNQRYEGLAAPNLPLPAHKLVDSQPPGGTFPLASSAGRNDLAGLTFATLVGGSPRSQGTAAPAYLRRNDKDASRVCVLEF